MNWVAKELSLFVDGLALILFSEGGILAVVQMQEEILLCVSVIDIAESVLGLQERVPREDIDRVVPCELQLLLDDHDDLEDAEGLENKDPEWEQWYLFWSTSFSLEFLTGLSSTGILSGWYLRIISASLRRYCQSYIIIVLLMSTEEESICKGISSI